MLFELSSIDSSKDNTVLFHRSKLILNTKQKQTILFYYIFPTRYALSKLNDEFSRLMQNWSSEPRLAVSKLTILVFYVTPLRGPFL